ncbi:DNA phosphorothioation system sulfurtransferase DndC [Phragmitibacter flavus]|uniref:DNA phosphorothioation system sulfurtransferase DndC n=1 Tax=Phragmitibacter flavus TaxID=2576071 RepID=A0A5R8KFX3_9BACT|nr:DNA phosphorothioation system sulfurtransferase DndC [Phragmitibacter flavus]TLD70489.1 DNA phosphorothioation system sulfurtransferase DndC [Phragmitibacter flavus]
MFAEIKNSLKELYLSDPRPWIIGFSGGKDSTMVASLIFDVAASIPKEKRTKTISVVCTDTRVEIPAIVEMIEGTLLKMRRFSDTADLNLQVHLLRPPSEQSFWVNIIGRGYPPPNRTFRWCTQRMKIDPVNNFVERQLGRTGQAILHLGARSSESSSRAQTLAGIELKNGLRRHPNLPRVDVSNPIEHLTTGEVWAYLLQNNPPWGGSNQDLYRLYKDAGGGECPIHIDSSTPSCGNSRFGCWTCTVVERDKASEGLLASGDERMESMLEFRELLLEIQDPANGFREPMRMNNQPGNGPIKIEGRRKLLRELLKLQDTVKLRLISDEELLLIQQLWKSAHKPDDGRGVARIINAHSGLPMHDLRNSSRLRKLEAEVADELSLSADTLQRLVAKVEEFSENNRAHGLPAELKRILEYDINQLTTDGSPQE